MSIENLLKQIKTVTVYKSFGNRKIKDLLADFNDENIHIPEYQRGFVWDIGIQSRFIESIFMEIPIPAIFLLEKDGDEAMYEVIDGVQRLSTLKAFVNDKLTLCNNLKLSDLDRTSFSKLPPIVTNLFLNKEINIITIKKNTDPEIQFEIFERLNRGSVSLTAQELRNCMYHSKFNSFLISLSEAEYYRDILSVFPVFKVVEDGKPDRSRMLDVEMILRFFALFETFAETGKFVSPRKEQLNFYMKVKKEKEKGGEDNLYSGAYLKTNDDLQTLFQDVCEMIKLTFKGNHYKRFVVNKSQAKFKNFNKSVFDVQMLGFSDYKLEFIENVTDIIYHEFIELSCFDNDFIASIDKSTDDKINERVNIWKNVLKSFFEDVSFYRTKLDKKVNAFNSNPECCHYSKHIKTIEECYHDNDGLQHIFCHFEKNNLKTSSKRTTIPDLDLPDDTEFRAKYKGDVYTGNIINKVLILPDGSEFVSPSAAAGYIVGSNSGSVNGWRFWEYRLPEESDWQALDTLR
jgi:hypothetical protein